MMDKSIKILMVGNSFADDSIQYVRNIFDSLGYKYIKVVCLYFGGCSIDMHLSFYKNGESTYLYNEAGDDEIRTKDGYYSLKQGIEDDDWDIITFQQVSYLSGLSSSYGNLKELVSIVKELNHNPNTKYAWLMTWSDSKDSVRDCFIENYGGSQEVESKGIRSCVKHIMEEHKFDVLIPTGKAIDNIRKTSIGDTLNRDGYHLSFDKGRYIASLSLALSISKDLGAKDIYHPPFVSEEEFGIMLNGVIEAINNPFND